MLTEHRTEFNFELIFRNVLYLENEHDIPGIQVHSTLDLVQGSTPAARDTPGTVLYIGRRTCKTVQPARVLFSKTTRKS
jgi:hypothetical protein